MRVVLCRGRRMARCCSWPNGCKRRARMQVSSRGMAAVIEQKLEGGVVIGQTKDHAHTHTRTHARTQRGEGNSNYSRYRAAAGRSSWRARRLGLRYHRPRPLACRSPGWSRACVLVCKWRIKHTVRCTTVQYHYSTALPNRMATLARTSETDQDLASPLPFSNSRPIHSHALLLLPPPN